jgi:hypothetical protein
MITNQQTNQPATNNHLPVDRRYTNYCSQSAANTGTINNMSFIYFIFHTGTKYIEGKVIASEPGSSVSIVSGYELNDRAVEVRSPAEGKGFFL